MEKNNAIWSLIGIVGGILYPIIHSVVLAVNFPFVYPLDYLGVQIIILRITLMFLFVTVLYLLIRAYQILKTGGKLKETSSQMTRISGKPKSGVMLGVGMGFIASALIIYGYIFSFPRETIFPFAAGGFGIGYWLVIVGIVLLFGWVLMRPIMKTLFPPSREKLVARDEAAAAKEEASEMDIEAAKNAKEAAAKAKEEAIEKAKEEKRKKKGIKTVKEMEEEMRLEEEQRLREMEKNRPKGELKTKI